MESDIFAIAISYFDILFETLVESSFGPNFNSFGNKWEFNIKFKFYNLQKAHCCMISRL